jgi:phosphoribosylformimino-5-aminoimidazole carboxamide ribotide isomerase
LTSQGAERLHVVDLDGAFAGAPKQTALITRMVAAVAPVPVEVGGGLRDRAAVDAVLETGARWAVVGTRAALDAVFLAEICRAHPGRVIIAVDARGGQVAVKGWTETSAERVVDVGHRAHQAGAAALLYTDVSRDGMEAGPNVHDTAALAAEVGLPILASGGVATIDNLLTLAEIEGVEGTVVGRALYTGAVNLRDALNILNAKAVSSAGFAGATDAGGRQGGARREARDDRRKGSEAPLRVDGEATLRGD